MKKNHQYREQILHGHIGKTMLKVAWPIILGFFMHTLYGITDAFWLGKVPGNVAVAAPGLVWTVIFLIISFAIGMGIAGTSLVAQHYGAGDNCRATLIGGQIFSLLFFMGMILSIIGLFIGKYIPIWMGAEGKFAAYSGAYLTIMFFGMPFHFLIFAYSSWKRGIGDSISPMKILSGSILMNMILDPIVIMPLALGWIETGNNEFYAVIGAASATVFSRIVFSLIGIYKVLKDKDADVQIEIEHLKPKFKFMKKIVELGVPASLGQAGTALGFVIMNSLVVDFDTPPSTTVFTTFFIATRNLSIFFMPSVGIAQALAMFSGQNIGAGNLDRTRKGFWSANVISIGIILIFTIFPFIFAPQLIAIFKNDPEVIQLGTRCMRIILVSLPFFPLLQNSKGLHQGTGHTGLAMFVSLGRLWFFRIPLVYLFKALAIFKEFPSDSVWYAMAVSNVLGGGLALIVYALGKWKSKTITDKRIKEEELVYECDEKVGR